MQNSEFRNPSSKWRMIAVAVVHAMIGATAGGLAALLIGGFFLCVLVGASVGAMVGAYSEARQSDDET